MLNFGWKRFHSAMEKYIPELGARQIESCAGGEICQPLVGSPSDTLRCASASTEVRKTSNGTTLGQFRKASGL
jgi:hypothetical protein